LQVWLQNLLKKVQAVFQHLKLKEDEDNENVKLFIDEYIDELDRKIESAKNLEEREEL
jgi:hypothetical protein